MKETALTKIHIGLGAKMAEFADYNMPISYFGIIEEHKAVRKNVGVFDVSHMGEFILKGDKALELIQQPDLKEKWAKKRQRLLADKIDVTQFMVDFIEHYPQSFYRYKEESRKRL